MLSLGFRCNSALVICIFELFHEFVCSLIEEFCKDFNPSLEGDKFIIFRIHLSRELNLSTQSECQLLLYSIQDGIELINLFLELFLSDLLLGWLSSFCSCLFLLDWLYCRFLSLNWDLDILDRLDMGLLLWNVKFLFLDRLSNWNCLVCRLLLR